MKGPNKQSLAKLAKQRIAELKRSEARFRTYIEEANDLIFTVDLSGKIASVNRATREVTGYTTEELLGREPLELVVPEARASVRSALRRVLRGEHVERTEAEVIARDGRRICLEVRGRLSCEGKRPVGAFFIARDITKRREAEEDRRRQADLLNKTLNSMTDAVFVLDAKLPVPSILQCNEAASTIFGYDGIEMLGRTTAFLHVSDETLKQFQSHLYHAVEDGRLPFHLREFQMKRRDGSVFASEHFVAQLLGDKGERVAWVSIVRDITERKRAEGALRQRAEELAALQSTVLDITARHDLPMLLQTIVERAALLLAAPAGGMYLCDPEKQEARCVVSHNTRHDYTGTVLKYGEGAAGIVAQTGKPLILDDYRKWPGRAGVFERDSPFRAVLTVPMIWQGRVTGVIHTLDDAPSRRFTQADQELLTLFANHAAIAVENARLLDQEKHHAEELASYSTSLERLVLERTQKLAESERRFRELSELLPQMVFEIDLNGNFTFLNRLGFASTGYTSDDLQRGLNAFQMFVPEDHDRARDHIRRILGGEKLGGDEYTALRKDGSTFPIIVRASPIIHQGKPVGLRGVAVDITERKQMEQRLLKSERLAAIGELAAMVGHDLRNPLTGIAGAVYYLKTKLGPRIDSRAKEILDLVEQGVEHSNEVINDLLDYSREVHLELAETSVRSITKQALALVKIPPGTSVVDSSEDEPRIMVDPQKMKRVFVNLIENAVDAMPKGGTLTIGSTQSKGDLKVSFTDTGVGIPREAVEKLWTPLFTTKAKGIGLGLPICRRIVEAHGGEIILESHAGKGTTITITLPLTAGRGSR